MPDIWKSRPRGTNFLLGGAAVAALFLGFLALGGSLDLGGFGVPSVRIEDPYEVLGSSKPPTYIH